LETSFPKQLPLKERGFVRLKPALARKTARLVRQPIGLLNKSIDNMPILHKINILIGCIFFMKASQYFIENIKLYKISAWLEKYQIVVYAIHGMVIPQLLKIYIKIIPLNGVFILTGYFIMIFFGVFVSLIFGIIFKKLLSKLNGILTGGRI
jgi:hypothetical protein